MSKLSKHFLPLTPEKFWGRHAERHHVRRAGTRQGFAQITLQQELGNTYLDTQPPTPWMENDNEYVLLIMATITQQKGCKSTVVVSRMMVVGKGPRKMKKAQTKCFPKLQKDEGTSVSTPPPSSLLYFFLNVLSKCTHNPILVGGQKSAPHSIPLIWFIWKISF